MIPPSDLPIEEVMTRLLATLRSERRLILTAPPGAGKTTRVPLALLGEAWLASQKLILVEPRRIAARAAAERMAATLAERVGQTIGLRSRLDVRTSAASRIEVVTEGVFTRMALADPGLEGIAAVIFDEVHERSLEGDEGLALGLNIQAVLRPDLRLILMSATLPPELSNGVFDAPVVASEGRAHPVETRYLGFDAGRRLEDQMAAAIRRAFAEETGSILAFLPGAGEIRRTAERLSDLAAAAAIAPLYGALTPAEQNAAIASPPVGQRKIVLATDIAESSLTIEGVRVVIDGGFARAPRFDASIGAGRLETVRIAIANADQRRGRAGRTQPGVCYRLWREAETRGFAPSPPPEIDNADLTGLCLDLARWGVRSPSELDWLTPPRETAWRLARQRLADGGALTDEGAISPLGIKLAELALPPRLALMVVGAGEERWLAAEVAALMSERELGGRSVDLDERLVRFRREAGGRAHAMRGLARRWADDRARPRTGEAMNEAARIPPAAGAIGAILAAAYPERIARARPGAPGHFLLAGGRGATLDETDPLARSTWLAVAELAGAGPRLRITLAARLEEEDALQHGGAIVEDEARYDPATRSVRARRRRRIGAIVLDDVALPAPPPELIRAGLLQAVEEGGLRAIPDSDALFRLIARLNFLAQHQGPPWPADFAEQLRADLAAWLSPVLDGVRTLDAIKSHRLVDAAKAHFDWTMLRELDRLAPETWRTPLGRSASIDYAAEGGPRLACRVQELYGLKSHPTVAGDAPITLELLSPAERPVALTRDLPGFWRGGYLDMRKDMKGRYPKHDWPDDPAQAAPGQRGGRRPHEGR